MAARREKNVVQLGFSWQARKQDRTEKGDKWGKDNWWPWTWRLGAHGIGDGCGKHWHLQLATWALTGTVVWHFGRSTRPEYCTCLGNQPNVMNCTAQAQALALALTSTEHWQ